VAASAVEPVVTASPVQPVVAVEALDDVGARAPAQQVASVRALDHTASGEAGPRRAGQRERCGRKHKHNTGQPPVGARADHLLQRSAIGLRA
jgi:hypothetical protein